MIVEFNWFSQPEVQNVLKMIDSIINIIRIIVPIALIVMTTFDLIKKVIDPNDKEGQKKIMYRIIAAVIVFFIPTLVNIVFKIMDIDTSKYSIKGSAGTSTQTLKPTVVPTIKPLPTTTAIPTLKPTTKPTPTSTPKLDNITLNCPTSDKYYKIGDVIEIKTDIPSSFNDNIKWEDKTESTKITMVDNGRSAKVEILDQPSLEMVWIVVSAGGKANVCQINISAVDKLEITNCPSKNKIYHIGDKFILESNLPSFYKSNYSWGAEVDPNIAKISPLDNGRRAQVEIVGIPKNKYIYIGFAADSPIKSSTCRINIE